MVPREKMKDVRIVLASKSPRRRELLRELAPEFEIIVAEVDEDLDEGIAPERGVEILALRKGAAVAKDTPDALVISSDTLVELDGVPLGKPRDVEEAKRMLSALSGNEHRVHTGVAVHYRDRVLSGVATTAVIFREIDESEIEEYIRTGEPMDKAGAYGIQGEGGKFVSEIRGDFDTVVGLSMKLTRELVSSILEVCRE